MPRGQNSQADQEDWGGPDYQLPAEVKPPFPASLMKEARRQVDLEEAVRWERDRRGLPKDGIDDWKRRSIIYAYLTMIVIAVFAYVGLVLN
jgi:hypothetical protein